MDIKQMAQIDIEQNNLSVEEASKLYNIPPEELLVNSNKGKKPETPESQIEEKVLTAKEVIINQALELLTEPLTPKDLKDILYVVNNITIAKEDKEEGFSVTIKKLMSKYGD